MSPSQRTELLQQYHQDLAKTLDYLDYSYQKVLKLPKHLSELDKETLEIWESFSARFSRAADIFTSKYLRLYVEIEEPGFRGSMRDLLNKSEKLGLVENADIWAEIRELRNMTAHEYSAEAFDLYMAKLLTTVPEILRLRQKFSI